MNDLILKTNTIPSDVVTDAVDTQATDAVDTQATDSAEELTTLVTDAVDTSDAEAAVTDAMTETQTQTVTATGKDTSPAGLSQTLPIMGKGMVGIFLVTAAIILVVAILNKVTTKK